MQYGVTEAIFNRVSTVAVMTLLVWGAGEWFHTCLPQLATETEQSRKEETVNTISMPVQGHRVMITMEDKPGLSKLETWWKSKSAPAPEAAAITSHHIAGNVGFSFI